MEKINIINLLFLLSVIDTTLCGHFLLNFIGAIIMSLLFSLMCDFELPIGWDTWHGR